MLRGAIFDLDGTLIDSMPLWDTLAEDYLRPLGIEPSEDLSRTFKSLSMEEAAQYYRAAYGVTLTVQEIVDGVNAMLAQQYREIVQPKHGVAELLAQLRENGVKMCIATANDRDLAAAALHRCGLLQYFSAIFTCTDVSCGKEQPTIYREALKHLGTSKRETFVFEDAAHALKTAKTDGFMTVMVYDKSEADQKTARAYADYCLCDGTLSDFWEFVRTV